MFFSNDNLSLELIGVFSIKRSKYKKHSRPRNHDSISIRISGNAEFVLEKKHITVNKDEVLYLPQNSAYEQKTDGEEIIAIHFINYSYTQKFKPELIKINDTEQVKSLIVKMYDLWNLKETGYRYECTSLFYHLLYILRNQTSQSHISSGTYDTLISNAVKYIHTHYKSEHIYVSELARMVSLSEVYFRKIFKRIYSISPNKYINNLKLEYALHLLKSQLYTISEISEFSGFSDVKYFTKRFKNKYGVSPKSYKPIKSDSNEVIK